MKKIISILFLCILVVTVFAGEKTTEKFTVKEIEPFYYACVEMAGSYDQSGAAFEQLYTQAGIQQIDTSVPPMGIYFNNPMEVAEEDLTWDIGIQVPDDKEIAEPLVKKKWEFTTLCRTEYTGVMGGDEMQAVYGEMFGWLAQNGYTPNGPLVQKFMDQMEQQDDGQWAGTVEIIVPVSK